MDIIIQSLGFKAGDALESFVNEKVSALKADRIVRANVTLFKGPNGNAENNYCEIRLEVPGNDHFVKRQGAFFETAITECVDVLTQQISRAKDKQTDRQADTEKIQDMLAQSDDDETELEDVVR